MRREIELQRRLRSLQTLGEAVGAMKNLSAHHFRQTRDAVEPARAYRERVEAMLGHVGGAVPAGNGGAGLLVIGGELGLCGEHNARLVELGEVQRSRLGDGPTFVVGRRAATLLSRRGVTVTRGYESPTSAPGIPRVLLHLAEDVLERYVADDLASFDIVSSRFAGVGVTDPRQVRLLPLQSSATDTTKAPRYVDRERFVSSVVREYLYILLYDILLDAMASEHGARLVATEGAEKWIGKRAERVGRHLSAARRETSTQEVLEIAAGARVHRARR